MMKLPKRRKRTLSVLIPSSYATQSTNNTVYVFRVGLLARACSILRVDNIIIYLNKDELQEKKNATTLKLILEYMKTPQYLRKYVFKKNILLRNIGVVPPLTTPSHPTKKEKTKIRYGYTLKKTMQGYLLDVGLEKLALVKNRKIKLNTINLIKLVRSGEYYIGKKISKERVPFYLDYSVTVTYKKLAETLLGLKKKKYFLIGTSRYGIPITERIDPLKKILSNQKQVGIVFGGPKQGIFDILGKSSKDLSLFNEILNMIPNQGVRVIHSDEALIATLSIINILLQ